MEENGVEVVRAVVPKQVMVELPADERKLIVVASVLGNEINVLNKWILFSLKLDTKATLERHGRMARFGVMLRLMAGKLYEGWYVVRLLLQEESPVGKEYRENLGDVGTEALTELETYFNANNRLKLIRNKFSFHYDHRAIVSSVEKLADENEYEIFLAPQSGNCVYWGAEAVLMRSLMNMTCKVSDGENDDEVEDEGEGDEGGQAVSEMDRCAADVELVGRRFGELVNSIILHFMRRHGVMDNPDLVEELGPEPAAKVREVDIPFIIVR